MEKMNIRSDEWKKIIMEGGESLGVPVSPFMADQLAGHCDLLLQWNRKINLTAITDPLEVAVKHVLDSIAPARLIPDHSTLLDMGTGGGFPGIPLKIVKPSILATLADASGKKINFVKHVIRTLKLEKCKAIAARLEDLPKQDGYAGKFQVVVSRSLAPLSKILSWALPLLAPRGCIIALKGRNVDKEQADVDLLMKADPEKYGFHMERYSIKREYYHLPHSALERTLVILNQRKE
jgi:16S rRNA (guanine527-N7)-methyltransferase